MSKGWYGKSKQHSLASKGVKTSIIVDEKSGIWFESQGIMIDVKTLKDTDCKANGYPDEEYIGDASKVVILPSSKVEESIDWVRGEYIGANRPYRKAQLEKLVKMTLNHIRLDLNK